jgi:hypothetical protein
MHLCSILLSVAMAATFVKAGQQSCLTQNEASSIIQGFTDLLTKTQANFNHTLATQLLASDFHTNSDGVDYVREEPVSQHLNRMILHFYIGDPVLSKLPVRTSSEVDSTFFCIAGKRDTIFTTGVHQSASLGSAIPKCDNAQYLLYLHSNHLAVPDQPSPVACQGDYHLYCEPGKAD